MLNFFFKDQATNQFYYIKFTITMNIISINSTFF